MMRTRLACKAASLSSSVASSAHRKTSSQFLKILHQRGSLLVPSSIRQPQIAPLQQRSFYSSYRDKDNDKTPPKSQDDDDDNDKAPPTSHEQQMLLALQEQNSLLKSLLERVESIEQKCTEFQPPKPHTTEGFLPSDKPRVPAKYISRKERKRPSRPKRIQSMVPASGSWMFQPPKWLQEEMEQQKKERSEEQKQKGKERIEKYVRQKLEIDAKRKAFKEDNNLEAMEALQAELEALQTAYLQAEQEEKTMIDTTSTSFGLVQQGGQVLQGRVYPEDAPLFTKQGDYPLWESHTRGIYRKELPEIAFNSKSKILNKSGVYNLVVRYNNRGNSPLVEAGIIIGEIEFNSAGMAWAEGADWDRLLAGTAQMQLPYAHGARGWRKWKSRKVTEPWQDGDKLRFWVDTNNNTLIFQRNDTPEKRLNSVLAFTNNPKFPDYLHAFAYCGGHKQENDPGVDNLDVKLTILPT